MTLIPSRSVVVSFGWPPCAYQPLVDRGFCASDVRFADRDARDESDRGEERAARRHRIEQLSIHHGGPLRALHVNGRRLTGNGHGFLEASDPQFRIDGGREIGQQGHAVTNEGRKPRQGEGHVVGARTKVHDRISSCVVRDRGAHLLDERRAGRLHGDPGQHRPAGSPSQRR